MGYSAVAGRVMVRSGSGWRKAVRSVTSSTVGSHMSNRPSATRFPVHRSFQSPSISPAGASIRKMASWEAL